MTLRVEVEAYNTAVASDNRIHDDEVAREYGFRGGLVPGVDVYAYMTQLPVAHWGVAWLRHGTATVRFAQPVYDGERVVVSGEPDGEAVTLTVTGPDGVVRASGRAGLIGGATDDRPIPPAAPLPHPRPSASAESLAPGTVLGSLSTAFDAARAGEYLTAVRDPLPIYSAAPFAHPGWLLRLANSVLSANVVLGPWIHVSSDVALNNPVGDGQALDVHAVVLDEYERKGHRFVELDVAVLSGDDVAQRVRHTAIHTPRRVER